MQPPQQAHKNKSLKVRVLQGLMWLGGLTFLGQLITWVVSITVIRLLTPKDYGLMAMAAIFISFLTLLSEMGLSSALIQKKNLTRIELQKVFGFVIWVDCLLCAAVLIIAPLCAIYFTEPRLISILRVMSISFLLLSFYIVPQSLMIRELDFKRKSIIEVIANLLSSAVVLAMAFQGMGVWALIGGTISVHAFKVVLFNLRQQDRIGPRFAVQGIGRMISFGSYVSITRILWFVYSQADIVIGGRIFGKELLGVYSIAMQLVSLPLDKISPLLNQIGFTAFSRQQEDPKAIQVNFLRLIRLANITMLPVFIGFALVAPELVLMLLGDKWTPTIQPIQILCLVMPLRFISTIFPPVVSGLGKPEIITVNMIWAVTIMCAAFMFGAQWGIIGLCYAWMAAFPVVFAIMLKRVIAALEISIVEVGRTTVLPLTATSIMAAGIGIFKYNFVDVMPAYLYLCSVIALGIVMYAGVVLTFRPSMPREIKAFLAR